MLHPLLLPLLAAANSNFTCIDKIDNGILAGTCILSYATVLGGILFCGNYLGRRLHDFTTECLLERHRQNELIERLLLSSYDNEPEYYEDEEGEGEDGGDGEEE